MAVSANPCSLCSCEADVQRMLAVRPGHKVLITGAVHMQLVILPGLQQTQQHALSCQTQALHALSARGSCYVSASCGACISSSLRPELVSMPPRLSSPASTSGPQEMATHHAQQSTNQFNMQDLLIISRTHHVLQAITWRAPWDSRATTLRSAPGKPLPRNWAAAIWARERW